MTNLTVEECVENVIRANKDIKIPTNSEEIDSFLDKVSFLMNFVSDINKSTQNLIESLIALTWLKKIDKKELYLIKTVMLFSDGSLKTLKLNNSMLKRFYGDKIPEIIQENLGIIEDLEETINDVSYSIFEHKDTHKMKSLYNELNDLV